MQAATVTIGEVELYYEAHGSGEPLLFLHGFTGCGGDWTFIGHELAERRQVIAPDLRGHGRSTNPSPDFLFRDAARDIRGLLKKLGLARVKAIGISGGGITLMHMALEDPACIESMILVSAPPYFPDEARAIMRAIPQEPHNTSDWDGFRQRHLRGDIQIAALMRQARGFAASYEDVAFTPERLQQIGAETLIVFGDRDPLYPVRLAVELRASIPRSFLWVVPNGGHGPVFGAQAAPFLQTADIFFSGSWRESAAQSVPNASEAGPGEPTSSASASAR